MDFDINVPQITTKRLLLREWMGVDVDPLFDILSDPAALRYFPGPGVPEREGVRRLVERQMQHWADHDYGWWAIEPRNGGDLMGWCGLQYLPETEEVEVGYLLGQEHWGYGYATEAARSAVKFGFERFGFDRIIGIVHPENVASQRVLQKVGMAFLDRNRYFEMDCFRYAVERKPMQVGGSRNDPAA